MSDAQRKAAAKSRGRIHLDQKRWNQAVQPQEHLAALRRAVWDDRRVRLRYRDRERKTTERTVDPLGLVAKAGIWYLVARAGEEYRTFRAERIQGVTPTDIAFVRPAGFDLDAFWQSWTSSVEESSQRFAVVLAVRRDALETVTAYWEAHVLADAADAETVRVRVIFPAHGAALHQLIAWGGDVRIVEPLEMRDELLARARALIAHHAVVH
jgi:predicted DNA-binding transcriptional regulator YafY